MVQPKNARSTYGTNINQHTSIMVSMITEGTSLAVLLSSAKFLPSTHQYVQVNKDEPDKQYVYTYN